MDLLDDEYSVWTQWDQDNEGSWHAGGLSEIDSFYDVATRLDDTKWHSEPAVQNEAAFNNNQLVSRHHEQDADPILEAASTLLSVGHAVSSLAPTSTLPQPKEELRMNEGELDTKAEDRDSAVMMSIDKTPASPVAPAFEPLSPPLRPVKDVGDGHRPTTSLSEQTLNDEEAVPPLVQDFPTDTEPPPEPQTPTHPSASPTGLKFGLDPSSTPASGRNLLKKEMRGEDIRVGHYHKTPVSPFPLATPKRTSSSAEPFNDADNPSVIPLRSLNPAMEPLWKSPSATSSPILSNEIQSSGIQNWSQPLAPPHTANSPLKRKRGRPPKSTVAATQDQQSAPGLSSAKALSSPPAKKQKQAPGPVRRKQTMSTATRTFVAETSFQPMELTVDPPSGQQNEVSGSLAEDVVGAKTVGPVSVSKDQSRPMTTETFAGAVQQAPAVATEVGEKSKDTAEHTNAGTMSRQDVVQLMTNHTTAKETIEAATRDDKPGGAKMPLIRTEVQLANAAGKQEDASVLLVGKDDHDNRDETVTHGQSATGQATVVPGRIDEPVKTSTVGNATPMKDTPPSQAESNKPASPKAVVTPAEEQVVLISTSSTDGATSLPADDPKVATTKNETAILRPTEENVKLLEAHTMGKQDSSPLSSLDSASTLTDLESDQEQDGSLKKATEKSTKKKTAVKLTVKSPAKVPPKSTAKPTGKTNPKTATKTAKKPPVKAPTKQLASKSTAQERVGARELTGMLGLLNDEGQKQQLYTMGGSPRATRNTRTKAKEAAAEPPNAAATAKKRHNEDKNPVDDRKAKKAKTKK